MIRVLLRLIGFCSHPHRYKEVRHGSLHLVCDRCLHAVPVLREPVVSIDERRRA